MVRQVNTRAEALPPRSARCAIISDGLYEWAGVLTENLESAEKPQRQNKRNP